MLEHEPIEFAGGEVRIAVIPISQSVAAAHVLINLYGLRTMHWHPNASEWSYFTRGRARVTIFASNGTAPTFNYQAGDIGIVPRNMAHYVENIGDEPVEMLEVFRASTFQDFSLEQ
jgi:oxalate decarboxylase family bicupin protein